MNAVYIILLLILLYVAKLPLNIYEGYFLEHRFHLSNQKISSWFVDDIKKFLISVIVFLIAIESIYLVLRHFPDIWWVYAAITWLFINLVLSKIMPNVIIPLFYKYIPLDNEELRQRILSLFRRCGVAIKDVYAIDLSSKTKKANAFVCGLGKNKRVVLGDTLISEFAPGEIEAVVAHELGHYKHHDILKMILWGFLFSFLVFFVSDIFLKRALLMLGFSRIDDIAFFPIFAICLLFIGFLILPIQNGFSRFLEKRADLFSLKMTQAADEFISMITRLGQMNLADFSPSRFIEVFLYDHPPISKRIKFAEEFKDNN
jgi:STE24 endopeptidase